MPSSRAELNSNPYYLPEEIWIRIFVRLTVKSLLRFRSVCKSWYTLITDPTFVQEHLKTSSENSYIILNYKYDLPRFYRFSIRYDDPSFREYSKPKLPSQMKQYLQIYGSCNGIICLSNCNKRFICLWNPALRKLKTLPKPPIVKSDFNSYTTYLAFGWIGIHPNANDYKVVRILCFERDIDKPYKDQFILEVYSLSTDSWRRIGAAPSCYIVNRKPAFANGAVFWVANRRSDEGFCCLLVRFKMGVEVFEEVMLPDGARHCFPYIEVLGELLYLFRFYRFGGNDCCDIWTMECGRMGSWTKRFSGDLSGTAATVKLLGLRKSGELLQVNMNNLVSYNFETQTAKDLGINPFLSTFSAYSYVESLIQLDGAESLFPLHRGNRTRKLANSLVLQLFKKEQHLKRHGF